jgi:hypothetical protein
VNEGNSTVTLTPAEVQLYPANASTWTVVNEAQFRAGTQAILDEYEATNGPGSLAAALASMGFSSASQYIDYWVSEEFAVKSMGYSFSGDGAALFLDGSLPASTGSNELSGKTLTRINYTSGWTVEFAGGYTYTIKSSGSPVESGEYSLSTGVDGDGFRYIHFKAQTRNGMGRSAYYDSLSSYVNPGNYEDTSARKAAETNGRFIVYDGWYKLNGETGEIQLNN